MLWFLQSTCVDWFGFSGEECGSLAPFWGGGGFTVVKIVVNFIISL